MARSLETKHLSLVLVLGLISFVFLYPVFSLLLQTGVWDWGVYETRRLFWTFLQAILSVVFCIMVAPYAAWLLVRKRVIGGTCLLSILWLPFITPTLIGGIAISRVYSGILGDEHPLLLLLANVFFNLPFCIRYMAFAIQQLPTSHQEAALMHGPQNFWLDVRGIKAHIISCTSLVLLLCFSNFSLAVTLAGPKYATLELELYERFVHELDIGTAIPIFWVIILCKAALCLLALRLEQRNQKPLPQIQKQRNYTQNATIIQHLCLFLLFVWMFMPLGFLFFGHLWILPENIHLVEIALRSILYSSCAVLFSAMLVVLVSRRYSKARPLFYTTWILPSTGMGMVLLMTYPQWLSQLWFLLLVFSLFALPHVTRGFDLGMRKIPGHTFMAAHMLHPHPTHPILLPMIQKDLHLGMALASMFALDLGISMTLQYENWQTLYSLVYQSLGIAGAQQMDQALTLSVITLAIHWFLFWVWLYAGLRRWGSRQVTAE